MTSLACPPVTVLFYADRGGARQRAWNSTLRVPAAPLGRNVPLRRGRGSGEVVDLAARRAPARRPATGFPAAVIDAVWARAGDGDPDDARCESCGVPVRRGQGQAEVQHRDARGIGGSRNPVTNSIVNAGLLCGSGAARTGCHGACEDRASLLNRQMNRRGWWLRNGQAPGSTPVQLYTRRWVLLLPDGRYGNLPPGAIA